MIKQASFVQLETQVDNIKAQALYEKCGFVALEPDTEFLVFRKIIL